MGCFEVYDIISGVSASGGPEYLLFDEKERNDLANGLVEKILAESPSFHLPGKVELKRILIEALFYVSDDAGTELVEIPRGSWQDPAVVIGTFGDDDEDEDAATIRFFKDYSMYGNFERMCPSDEDWEDEDTLLHEEGSLFMDLKCWHYIRAWASRLSGSGRSLEQQLYDTFTDDLERPSSGLSANLNYGLMHYMNGQFQDSFLQNSSVADALEFLCLDGAPNLVESISNGARAKDLAPALLADFQVWILIQFSGPIFRTFDTPSEPTPKLLTVPLEVLLDIFSSLFLADIINVSSTSKAMRQLATKPILLPLLLRNMITSPHGSLRWIQPCPLVEGEVEKANEALRTWTEFADPLSAPDFPFVEFVHTCLVQSNSMRNRRRLWRMIKQVEDLIYDGNTGNGDGDSKELEGATDDEENPD
ncbi:hypothetical protein DL96DRAFT_1607633 [Flagelloscypha sp. PMI_526]|nr:hypothetical protein DL96DRAFT_1607633 [Flagelloscypha sp. PMI_526]